jgi:hypothetical protein
MRKRIKTITEETHEYGTIAIENSLFDALLGYANADACTTEHIDLMVTKTIKISEEEEGEPLTVADHLVPITAGTPVASDAAAVAAAAV